ncbi:hypothetical protein ACFWD7_42565 [Streptomyces mirabilis]|uniref:hypothetical protein n=1 Tax=Streptomyces mirabilis TaxID=68239 RepID=UPI0021C0A924|nr:hypothetical protein [Streptomyces mirabilis]MCT9110012.1 hypothetical protein [Streptomyces mirabilis]
MDFDGRASVADAEFDDPVRLLRPVLPALFLFGFPLLKGGDLGVDALQPHGVPHPHSVESDLSSVLGSGSAPSGRHSRSMPKKYLAQQADWPEVTSCGLQDS